MIRLDTYQRKLQAVLGGAVTTSQPTAVICYTDIENENQKKFFVESVTSTLNGVTPVDILPAPDKAMVREVDSIHIRNNDTVAAAITVRINDNGTNYELVEVTILPGETLVYTDSEGWKVVTVYGNSASIFGYIDFANGTFPAAAQRLKWNDTDGTLDLGLKGGNVTLQIGQEQVMRVKEASNNGLEDGKVYYFVGSDGTNKTVAKARANNMTQAELTLGIATETVTGGNKGFICTFGLVRDIDTNHLTEGAPVYLSAATAGELVSTIPAPPNYAIQIGYCIRKSATVGSIFVDVESGTHLEYLHDVKISSLTDKQYIRYNSALGYWENTSAGDFSTLSATGNVSFDGGSFVFNESGGDKDFRIEGDTEQNLVFTDASTDRVGIGTNLPLGRLHTVISGAANNTFLDSYGFAANAIFRRANGTIAAPTALLANDNIATFGARGYDGSVFTSTSKSFIGLYAADNWSSTVQGTYIAFFNTASGTTTRSESARIDPSGNLGIGTTAPGEKLHVIGAVTVGGQALANKTSAGTFDFYATDNATRILSWGSTGVGGSISFWTGLGGSGTTEKMRIDSSGNVGIGRVPTYSLDVNSTARFNTTIGVGNTAPSASGAGISFPATQSASTDANTLDDYEESTWTPTDGSGAGLTFTDVTARYTKIGNVVTVFAKLTYPTTASAAQAKIDGLPFAATDGGQLMYCSSSTTTTGLGQGYIVAGTTTATLVTQTSASRTNAQLSTLVLYFSGTYLI